MLACLSSPITGQTKVILANGFDDGTGKWEKRGASVSIRSTDKQAVTGKKSLFVRGRKEFWQGAQLNVTNLLKAGRTYRFSVSVRLDDGSQPAVIKMTMQRGDNRWDPLSSTIASDTAWAAFSGSFKYGGGDPYLLIYLESEDPTVSFFIDEFRIEEFDIDEKKTGTLLKTDFQDGTAQGWLVHGAEVQVFSGMIGSNFVVKVDGRKESWQGLAIDVTPYLFKGRKYRFSISAMLSSGEATDTVRLRLRQTTDRGKEKFVEVASADDVNGALWSKLAGEVTIEEDGNYLLIVEAARPNSAFFLDDFELSAL